VSVRFLRPGDVVLAVLLLAGSVAVLLFGRQPHAAGSCEVRTAGADCPGRGIGLSGSVVRPGRGDIEPGAGNCLPAEPGGCASDRGFA
jgi:hypothetical protein